MTRSRPPRTWYSQHRGWVRTMTGPRPRQGITCSCLNGLGGVQGNRYPVELGQDRGRGGARNGPVSQGHGRARVGRTEAETGHDAVEMVSAAAGYGTVGTVTDCDLTEALAGHDTVEAARAMDMGRYVATATDCNATKAWQGMLVETDS